MSSTQNGGPLREVAQSGAPGVQVSSEDGYAAMMRRHLGPEIMALLADDDVRELSWNPTDGALWVDRGQHGRVTVDIRLDARRVEMFLNVAAAREHIALGRETPSVQASLLTVISGRATPRAHAAHYHRSDVRHSPANGLRALTPPVDGSRRA